MNGDENATDTATMAGEEQNDEMQASVNEAAMAAEEDNGGMDEMPDTGMDMEGGSEMTKWLTYAVILVIVLGALWYLFLR